MHFMPDRHSVWTNWSSLLQEVSLSPAVFLRDVSWTKPTGKSRTTCSDCDFTSASSSGIYAHCRRALIEARPYACEVCKKSFTDAGSLRCHTRIHADKRALQCDVCDKRFRQAHHLKDPSSLTYRIAFECTQSA